MTVGGRLVVDVDIVLGEVVIGVRNHVVRGLVLGLRLLVHWVGLFVSVGRRLVVIQRRWRVWGTIPWRGGG